MPMNPIAKTLWIEALRSEEYEQTKYGLISTTGEMCCLGVLCDVFRKVTGQGRWLAGGEFNMEDHIGSTMSLPKFVMDWAGLDHSDPTIAGRRASQLNDVDEFDFKQIANKIEKHL